MDEKKEFSVPGKKPLFNREEEPKSAVKKGFIETFVNNDGSKAVNLAMVEDDDGEIRKHSHDDLQSYADSILSGGKDEKGLQVGKVFSGEDAEKEAKSEAEKLTSRFEPEDGADTEEILEALEDAKDNKPEANPMKRPDTGTKPQFMGGKPGTNLAPPAPVSNLPKPNPVAGIQSPKPMAGAPMAGQSVDQEPMLKQLTGK